MNTSSKLFIAVACLLIPDANAAGAKPIAKDVRKKSRLPVPQFDSSSEELSKKTEANDQPKVKKTKPETYPYDLEWRCSVPKIHENKTTFEQHAFWTRPKSRISIISWVKDQETKANANMSKSLKPVKTRLHPSSVPEIRRILSTRPMCCWRIRRCLKAGKPIEYKLEFRRAGHKTVGTFGEQTIIPPQYYGRIERNQVPLEYLQYCNTSGDFSKFNVFCSREWEKVSYKKRQEDAFESIRKKLYEIERSLAPSRVAWQLDGKTPHGDASHDEKSGPDLVWIYRIAEIYHGSIERMPANDVEFNWVPYTPESQGFNVRDNWSIRRQLRKVLHTVTPWRIFKNFAYRAIVNQPVERKARKGKTFYIPTGSAEIPAVYGFDEEVMAIPAAEMSDKNKVPQTDSDGQENPSTSENGDEAVYGETADEPSIAERLLSKEDPISPETDHELKYVLSDIGTDWESKLQNWRSQEEVATKGAPMDAHNNGNTSSSNQKADDSPVVEQRLFTDDEKVNRENEFPEESPKQVKEVQPTSPSEIDSEDRFPDEPDALDSENVRP